MKALFKKTSVMIASFIVLCLGVSTNCLSIENHIEEFGKDVGLSTEIIAVQNNLKIKYCL